MSAYVGTSKNPQDLKDLKGGEALDNAAGDVEESAGATGVPRAQETAPPPKDHHRALARGGACPSFRGTPVGLSWVIWRS